MPQISTEQLLAKIGQLTIENDLLKQSNRNMAEAIPRLLNYMEEKGVSRSEVAKDLDIEVKQQD